MGMFVGLSVRTIADYLELVAYLSCTMFRKCRWKRQMSRDSEKTKDKKTLDMTAV